MVALAEARRNGSVTLYAHLIDLAARLHLAEVAPPDHAWIKQQEDINKRELARLEGELRGYKNNLIRESMRIGQEEVALHHLRTGGPSSPDDSSPATPSGFVAAARGFTAIRDYCSVPDHVAGMNLHSAYTSILQAVAAQQMGQNARTHWQSAAAHASRLYILGLRQEEQAELTPIVEVVTGIAALGEEAYSFAANEFIHLPSRYVNLGPIHGRDFARTVATGNDVAIYGGLCALATMSRDELLRKVLEGSFRTFLELEPHMRQAISLFTNAKYRACLDTLQRYSVDWNLDIYLGARRAGQSHVDRLLAMVRRESIVAHFSSFSAISLSSLASTFPPSPSCPIPTEEELLPLIHAGKLNARVDLVSRTLVAPERNPRMVTFANARAAADEVEKNLLLRLHQVNVALAGLDITRPKPNLPIENEGGLRLQP